MVLASPGPSKGKDSTVGPGPGSSRRRWVAEIDYPKIAGGYGCNQLELPKRG